MIRTLITPDPFSPKTEMQALSEERDSEAGAADSVPATSFTPSESVSVEAASSASADQPWWAAPPVAAMA